MGNLNLDIVKTELNPSQILNVIGKKCHISASITGVRETGVGKEQRSCDISLKGNDRWEVLQTM